MQSAHLGQPRSLIHQTSETIPDSSEIYSGLVITANSASSKKLLSKHHYKGTLPVIWSTQITHKSIPIEGVFKCIIRVTYKKTLSPRTSKILHRKGSPKLVPHTSGRKERSNRANNKRCLVVCFTKWVGSFRPRIGTMIFCQAKFVPCAREHGDWKDVTIQILMDFIKTVWMK